LDPNARHNPVEPAQTRDQADLMVLPTLDIALRAGTAALLLLLAALLFRDFRSTTSGRLAIAFSLGSAAHAVSSAAGFATPVTPWRAPLIALSTGNVVVFWLFARVLFDDAFELRRWHALPWAAVVGISLVNCLVLGPASSENFRILGVGIHSIAMSLIALGFIALAVGQTVASWPIDLVESRRRLRIFIVAAAAVYGGVNAILQLMVSGGDQPGVVNTANAAMLAGVVVAIAYSITRVAGADLFSAAPFIETAAEVSDPAIVSKRDNPGAVDQKLIDALTRLMADDRIYRDEKMTIGTLALRLAVPEYKLRRLINRGLGYRNFNVFLNDHRIREAKAALADPTQAEVPVITIAMDAGFQSLGPFNRAFKATTGVTPSEYRRLNGAPIRSSKSLLSDVNFEIG
jgi:AraC-like DNA-binding protein